MAERLIYLHGFASGPRSYKAQYLQRRFAANQRRLEVPDLNQGGFLHLTLTRQVEQVGRLIAASPKPVALIGSSFGGLTAAWVAERYPQVTRLILLAPAFEFGIHLQAHLGTAAWQGWQQEGTLSIYHHGFGGVMPLDHNFAVDLMRYPDRELKRPLPTHIIHGDRDSVIPVATSERYQQKRAWVTLNRTDDDHNLTNSLGYIWQQLQQFGQSR